MRIRDRNLIVTVDFDGCLTTTPYGDDMILQDDAREALLEMKALGIELILWSCRHVESLERAKDFLEKEGLLSVFSKFNENSDAISSDFNPRKILADVYLDDRNVGGWIGWEKALAYVKKANSDFLAIPVVNSVRIENLNDKCIISLEHVNNAFNLPPENAKIAFSACCDYFERVMLGFEIEDNKIITSFPLNQMEVEKIVDLITSRNTLCSIS